MLFWNGAWAPVKALAGERSILGVDRHGNPASATANILLLPPCRQCAFLGTAACFGEFSLETHLVDASGITRSLGSIIDQGDASSSGFETLLPPIRDGGNGSAAELIWSAIEEGAATKANDFVAIRSRSKRGEASAPSWIGFKRIGDQDFVIASKPAFLAAFRSDWIQTLNALGDAWFRNSDQQRLELQRTELLLGIWLLSAKHQSSGNYRLAYDTLQHSAVVLLCDDQRWPEPIERGLTAFLSTDIAGQAKITWTEPSWNPVSSGFVLVGR
jgi:hypothetical protein